MQNSGAETDNAIDAVTWKISLQRADKDVNCFPFYARKQNASRVFAIVWASVCLLGL